MIKKLEKYKISTKNRSNSTDISTIVIYQVLITVIELRLES